MKTEILLLLFFTMCFSANLFSQIEATTKDGKKVLLKEDGTWEYLIKEKFTPTIPVTFNKEDCVYSKNEVDDFSGEKILSLKGEVVGKISTGAKVRMTLFRVGDLLGFNISSNGDIGCVSQQRSKVSIKLINGEVIEFLHIGDTDCDDTPYFTLTLIPGGTVDELNSNGLEGNRLRVFKRAHF